LAFFHLFGDYVIDVITLREAGAGDEDGSNKKGSLHA
jgi:hypothetical protein